MAAQSPGWIRRCWPLLLLGVGGAAVYCLMTILLAESLSAERVFVRQYPLAFGKWGGPSVLLALAAGVVGWASVQIGQRCYGFAGPPLWLYSALGWAPAAFGAGAWLALYSNVPYELATGVTMICVVTAIVVSAVTTCHCSE